MAELTIGEVAQRAGVRASAIRYYESIGLLPEPRRVGGKRRYAANVLDRLGVIQLAQDAGFTLDEVRVLMHGFSTRTPASKRWRKLAQHKLEEIDASIARAQMMKRMLENLMECGCIQLDDCGRARREMQESHES